MSNFSKTKPVSLAKMMSIGDDSAGSGEWSDADLGGMLRHQLAAPIEEDLASVSSEARKRFDELKKSGQPLPSRFEDLLHSGQPPAELLEMTKDFAKRHRADPDGPMQKIATVIYYASILAARKRLGKRISELNDSQLAQGAKWAAAQPWVDEQTRKLLQDLAPPAAG